MDFILNSMGIYTSKTRSEMGSQCGSNFHIIRNNINTAIKIPNDQMFKGS